MFVWLLTGFGKSICYQDLPFVIEYKKGQRGSTVRLLLLVMTTCFKSNQIFGVGGSLWFLYYSYVLFFSRNYYSSFLVNSTQFCGYGTMRVWNWCAFIIG